MANEIKFTRDPDDAFFVVVRRYSDNTVWYPTGSAFEAWGTGSRDVSDYAIAASGDAGGLFLATFPSGQALGLYLVEVYVQYAASPADTDEFDGSFFMGWNGTAEVGRIRSNNSMYGQYY